MMQKEVGKPDRRAEPETDIDEMTDLQQGVSRLLENKKQYESSMNRYNRKYTEHSPQLALNGIAVKSQVSFTFYDQKKLVNCIRTGKEENAGYGAGNLRKIHVPYV